MARILFLVWCMCSGSPEWTCYQQQFAAREQQYFRDNDCGTTQSFLNREFQNEIFDVKHGLKKLDEEKICFLLAMYHEKDCVVPVKFQPYILDRASKYFLKQTLEEFQ